MGEKHFQKMDSKDKGNNAGAWKSCSRTSKPVDEAGCSEQEKRYRGKS